MKTPEEIGREILDAIKGYVGRTVTPILARLSALESSPRENRLLNADDVQRSLLQLVDALSRRIETLESTKMLYRGTWIKSGEYNENSLVTDHGSLWICRRRTASRPGNDSSWQLVAKRGGVE